MTVFSIKLLQFLFSRFILVSSCLFYHSLFQSPTFFYLILLISSYTVADYSDIENFSSPSTSVEGISFSSTNSPDVSTADNTSNNHNSTFDGTFFSIVLEKTVGKSVDAVCEKCKSQKYVEVKGQINSTSNFRSYLQKLHGDAVLVEYAWQIKGNKKIRLQEMSSVALHNGRINKHRNISQEGFDAHITNYILHSMASLWTVEDSYSREIFYYLKTTGMLLQKLFANYFKMIKLLHLYNMTFIYCIL